jgi:hypothetical protein
MNKYLLLLVFCAGGFTVNANCNNAYASAGYSLSHTKKSMSANNFDHQQYYAERALAAFEKAKVQNETCGCQNAMNPILDGIENLQTALNQSEWDMGRFYTKKALENAEQLLSMLDMCSSDGPGIYSSELTKETGSDPATSVEKLDPRAEAEIWEAKQNFKRLAEIELAELERSIRNTATLFGCEKALQILQQRKTRTEDELRGESLEKTKAFYVAQVTALHNKALFALLECSKK